MYCGTCFSLEHSIKNVSVRVCACVCVRVLVANTSRFVGYEEHGKQCKNNSLACAK